MIGTVARAFEAVAEQIQDHERQPCEDWVGAGDRALGMDRWATLAWIARRQPLFNGGSRCRQAGIPIASVRLRAASRTDILAHYRPR